MKIIEGDLFEVAKNGLVVHQVNCKGVMGAGFAKQLAIRFPEIEQAYREYCKGKPAQDLLGQLWMTPVKPDGVLTFGHSFSQIGTGSGLQTYTHVLATNLYKAKRFGDIHKVPVYVPWRIGCGLAGGDWDVIGKYCTEYGLTVVRRPGDN